MSELPPGWLSVAIGDVCQVVGGSTPKTGMPEYWGGDVPWLTPDDLARDRAKVVFSGRRNISELGHTSISARMLPAGSVLFSSRAPIGYVAIAGRPMCTNQGFKSLVLPREGLVPDYVYWYLMHATPLIESMASGTTFREISKRRMQEVPLPLPPLAEQERIVAAIEEYLSRLDAAEAATASARQRLAALHDSLLQATFDPAWPREMLDSLNDPERPICYGILKPKTQMPGTVPYVEVRSIAKGQIKVDELHRTTMALHQEFRRSELRPGDVTLAVRGSFDRAAVVPEELVGANVSRDVARIAPTPHLLSEFLAAFLVSPEARRFFRTHARGVAVQGINIGDLRRLPVPKPTVEAQKDAIQRVEAARSAIDRIEGEVRVGDERSRQLRRSILAAAFSGKVVAQDPDDEPASMLVERIRAERAAIVPAKSRRKVTVS